MEIVKRVAFSFSPALLTLLLASGASASPLTLDQSNLVEPTSFTSTYYIQGQQFTPTLPLLGRIDTWLNGGGDARLEIYDANFITGTFLGSSDVVSVNAGGALYSFNFSTPIAVNVGTISLFKIVGLYNFINLGYGGTYAGGSSGSGDFVNDPNGIDLIFATYGLPADTPVPAVPEPSSLILVGTGIGACVRWWRTRRPNSRA